jgi:hypothetical protein
MEFLRVEFLFLRARNMRAGQLSMVFEIVATSAESGISTDCTELPARTSAEHSEHLIVVGIEDLNLSTLELSKLAM